MISQGKVQTFDDQDFDSIKIGDVVRALYLEEGIITHRDIIIRGYDEKTRSYYGEERGMILEQGEEYPYDVDEDNFCLIRGIKVNEDNAS